MTKSQTQELLPWNNEALESLLKRVIEHGAEPSKIDFKIDLELGTPDKKADFLKDVISIANTDHDGYDEHGFIIYGVRPKEIVGITATEPDTDKLQATIDQLLREYLSPMPQVFIIGFETPEKKKWGAVVITPYGTRPFMFFKDLSCSDPGRSRRKGDWFVRRGSTTDRGLPEDLARINQRQTERLLEPLRESVRTLQSQVAKVEEQYNSALFKLLTDVVSRAPQSPKQSAKAVIAEAEAPLEISDAIDISLSSRLKQKLKTPTDKLAEDLVTEAKRIRQVVESSDGKIPWAPQLTDPEKSKAIIAHLEETTAVLQESIATIVLNDHKGIYTEALLRSLQVLARMNGAPSGVPYNRIGTAIRYYPLGLLVYTIFVCAVRTGRHELLRRVLDIPLKPAQKRNKSINLLHIFFFWHDAEALINNAFGQTWCAPLQMRTRQLISDRVSESMLDGTEPEYFFQGEFVLALAGVDMSILEGESAEYRVPLAGLYLYYDEAMDIIGEFLKEYPLWFETFYKSPLADLLTFFDLNAHKMASPNCIPLGLRSSSSGTATIYAESFKEKHK